MVAQIVRRYWEETLDMELLQLAVPILDKEYQFWMNNRSVSLDIVSFQRNQYSYLTEWIQFQSSAIRCGQ